MIPLRTRFAALVLTAIIIVVVLASAAAFLVMPPPDPQRTSEPLARQIQLIAKLSEAQLKLTNCNSLSGLSLVSQHPSGEIVGFWTDTLRSILAREGAPLDVIVLRSSKDGPPTIWVPIGDCGFTAVPIGDMRPPTNARWIFAGWMLLIVLGTGAVALAVARRLAAPLATIEKAIASVDADGILPDLPQRGPPEVRATAEALKRLSIRLKAAMESRMRLVAAAGHDLRTPMTRMRLRAEFLQEGERDVWLSDLDELERIADSAIRLVREETEASAQELFALDRLVHDVIDELATLGFKIIAGSIDSAKVRGSPFGSARALRNLMINAATHGEGAVVSLTVSDFIAHVLIDDRGPGIPEQLLNHVFEPFFRVDQARRQSLPGAGLGLAIAKEIIDRQGGAIVVTNRSDGGLRQDVSFPPATANENHE